MTFIYLMIAGLIGALGRRIAGGLGATWTGIGGTQWQRLVWGCSLAGLAAIAGLWWPYALAHGVAIWAGSSLFGHAFPGEDSNSGGLSMGRDLTKPYLVITSKSKWMHDVIRMAYHGLGGVLLSTLGAYYLGLQWEWLLLAGLLCVPCYELAYRLNITIKPLGCEHAPPGSPVPLGELLWGAMIGMGTILTLIG